MRKISIEGRYGLSMYPWILKYTFAVQVLIRGALKALANFVQLCT
jgi:hypothetical protein